MRCDGASRGATHSDGPEVCLCASRPRHVHVAARRRLGGACPLYALIFSATHIKSLSHTQFGAPSAVHSFVRTDGHPWAGTVLRGDARLARPRWLRDRIDCGMDVSAPSPSSDVEAEVAPASMQVVEAVVETDARLAPTRVRNWRERARPHEQASQKAGRRRGAARGATGKAARGPVRLHAALARQGPSR